MYGNVPFVLKEEESRIRSEIDGQQLSVISDDTSVLAAMKDRASTNNLAMNTLKIVYSSVVDVGRFSHTIDHVGGRFGTPTLSEFINCWISLFSCSPKTRLLWKAKTGHSISSYSATRRWSKWEVVRQVLLYFGDMEIF